MKNKLDRRRYTKLITVYNKLCSLSYDFEGRKDMSLSYGNGSVYEQLDCALAALQCIMQEF